MRTAERLRAIQKWTYETLCAGRKMKTPAPGGDVRKIIRQEPKAFLAYPPRRPDYSGWGDGGEDPLNACPGIVIAPTGGYLKNMEEERFDRYDGVRRPMEMGQTLSLQMIFFVFEDGVRLPGFIDSAESGEYDMTLNVEGTEEGFLTLVNWMDDFEDAILSAKTIPGTDCFLKETGCEYSPYTDQKFIADRRPVFIGIENVTFNCHADEFNREVQELLR